MMMQIYRQILFFQINSSSPVVKVLLKCVILLFAQKRNCLNFVNLYLNLVLLEEDK